MQALRVVCKFVEQSTQNLIWCGNSHPRNPRIEFKINCQFFKTLPTGTNDANTTEQSGCIAYPCGFSEGHWR